MLYNSVGPTCAGCLLPRRACNACLRCRYRAPGSNAPDPPAFALRKAVRRGTCLNRKCWACHSPSPIMHQLAIAWQPDLRLHGCETRASSTNKEDTRNKVTARAKGCVWLHAGPQHQHCNTHQQTDLELLPVLGHYCSTSSHLRDLTQSFTSTQ